jgi:Tol biopolymer transport system component
VPRLWSLAAVCVAALAIAAGVAPAATTTELVNVAPGGGEPDGGGWWSSMSADGRYIAFQSWADNLDPRDGHNGYDIFVRDRLLGVTKIASLTWDDQPANGASFDPGVSANGRVVVFSSLATNLVPDDSNGVRDIFVRDLDAGTTERVSVSSFGEQADADCEWPAVSGDGRYVVFHSAATTLASGGNGFAQVYLHDRWAHTTTRISVSSTGEIANYDALKPRISETGRYVLFCSYADNLAPNDHNNEKDLLLRDLWAGTTERISVANATGIEGNARSPAAPPPAITPDGRYVAFSSEASNLVAGDANGLFDIFVRDRVLGTTELVSVSSSGEHGNGESGHSLSGLAISADGRYVAFGSLATNLVPGDTNGVRDVFLRDRVAGATQRISVSTSGEQGDAESGYNAIAMSADASVIAFDSSATNFSDLDPDDSLDVFVRAAEIAVTPPLVTINDGSAFTGAAHVTLHVDPGPWTQLRFRNEFGSWSAWQAASSTITWDLSAGDGLKWVWVQGHRAADGDSVPSAAAVLLDTVSPSAPTVTINAGAKVSGRQVTLTITRPPDGVRMRLGNEGEAWTEWMPSVSEMPWALPGDDGPKRVCLQVRDPAGNESPVAWDDTVLDATPPSGVSVSIEGGAATTRHADVALTLAASGATEMRLRNESEDWTEWVPFAPSLDWTLPGPDGVKRVYLQARDLALNVSDEASDDILLDTTPPAGLSVVINGGEAATICRAVTLTLTAAGATGMRLRNENGSWSDWEPLASTEEWMLSAGRGAKVVGLQCRDDAGNLSAIASGSILLTDFTDVAEDFWAYREVMACVDASIVQGYSDDTYHPEREVTRDQMSVYIARALAGGDGHMPIASGEPTFTDIGADFWAYQSIEYCAAAGIVQGYDDNTYRADLAVTRDQMAVYIARAIADPVGEQGLAEYTGPASPTFTDVPTDYWAYRYIEYAQEHDIVHGYSGGRYQPELTVTRDQMAVYIQRALNLEE